MTKEFTTHPLLDHARIDWESASMQDYSRRYAKEHADRAREADREAKMMLAIARGDRELAVKAYRAQRAQEFKSAAAADAFTRDIMARPTAFTAAMARLRGVPVKSATELQRKELVGFLRAIKDTSGANVGRFVGYLSTFNHVDEGGDTVDAGAYTDTIQAAQSRRVMMQTPYLWPILYQHDAHQPIGGFTDARQDDKGLMVEGEIDLNTDIGRQAWSGVTAGYLRGLSIGYNPAKVGYISGVRHLQKVDLMEGSLVTFPMDTYAGVTSAGVN